ncbi:hypothetical protein F2P56_008734 [Juglans regia]|uniref:O-fucosyltransferase family protein n=1 Tax=Juglans regia TaxID=51240 RepID=A0A834D1B5_JUGRE|nr:hypothetical protein F2P56_008734 [Juglans regia]
MTLRLLHVDLLYEKTMRENILYIKQLNCPTKGEGMSKNKLIGCGLNHGTKSVQEINTILLMVALCDESLFVAINRPIWTTFDMIDPTTSNDVHVQGGKNKLPSKMFIKSKMKWVTLSLLILSLLSLLTHLSVTKFSTADLVQYSAMAGLRADFANVIGSPFSRNKKIWGVVKSLESLQPYANPRSSYPVPKERSNGFIYAKVFGGFANIRSSICDLVTISRLLNATLVIPEIQESTRSKGISSKFKSFSYLYNEEQFISSLKNDIMIVKSLPRNLKTRRNEFPTFRPKSSASPKYYMEEILPKLKEAKVVGLVLTDGGCLQSILPPSMAEFQRLRCRVAFHALQFRTDIQILGHRMLERLRGWGQPFLAFHPGLLRDTLAYHGCAELFQDVHTELIQYRRAQMIKRGIVNEELSVNSHLRRENGSCPLMPEEVCLVILP